MAIKDTLKKQFLFDGLVIGVIIIVVIVAFGIIGNGSVGWEIKNKLETVENEEKTLSENIYIHDGGKLDLISSTINFIQGSEFSIWLEGDAHMDIKDSVITSEASPYSFVLYGKNGSSPKINIQDSDILQHYAIFLKDDSQLVSSNSILGNIIMMGNSSAEISKSETFLTLDSEKKETYSNLSKGPSKKFKLVSREGWSVDLNNVDVLGYKVIIDDGDEVILDDFSDVIIQFSIDRGDDENFLELPSLSESSSGKISKFGYNLEWKNTVFSGFSFALSDSSIKIKDTLVKEIIMDSSELNIVQSNLEKGMYRISNSSIVINTVTFEDQLKLEVYDNSSIEISNSDIDMVTINLYGDSGLTLKNCNYDKSNINNYGEGKVEII